MHSTTTPTPATTTRLLPDLSRLDNTAPLPCGDDRVAHVARRFSCAPRPPLVQLAAAVVHAVRDRNGWLTREPLKGIERKRERRDETKAIAYDDVDALWSRPDVTICG